MELFHNITQNLTLSKQIISNKDSYGSKNNLKEVKKKKKSIKRYFLILIPVQLVLERLSLKKPTLLYVSFHLGPKALKIGWLGCCLVFGCMRLDWILNWIGLDVYKYDRCGLNKYTGWLGVWFFKKQEKWEVLQALPT